MLCGALRGAQKRSGPAAASAAAAAAASAPPFQSAELPRVGGEWSAAAGHCFAYAALIGGFRAGGGARSSACCQGLLLEPGKEEKGAGEGGRCLFPGPGTCRLRAERPPPAAAAPRETAARQAAGGIGRVDEAPANCSKGRKIRAGGCCSSVSPSPRRFWNLLLWQGLRGKISDVKPLDPSTSEHVQNATGEDARLVPFDRLVSQRHVEGCRASSSVPTSGPWLLLEKEGSHDAALLSWSLD